MKDSSVTQAEKEERNRFMWNASVEFLLSLSGKYLPD